MKRLFVLVVMGMLSVVMITGNYAQTLQSKILWVKKSNVAQYKNADWRNMIKRVNGISLQEAKGIADENTNITYFFYTKGYQMVLEGKGVFRHGDAVFFSGRPWYGSAPGLADAYEKIVR